MSRKHSKYKPKGVNPMAHVMAMMGACRLSTDDALLRAERVRGAVDAACTGRASQQSWRLLFDAVNVAEQLVRAKRATGRDAVDSLQDTIAVIVDRERTDGTRALHAAEIAALRGFAADYAGLLSGLTQQQYMQARAGVEDRIRRILSGEKLPASIRVIESSAP